MDIEFDKNLEPNITQEKNLSYIRRKEKYEQHLRLVSIDRLFGVLKEIQDRNVENKIRVTLRRIARDLDYLENIQNIKVEKVQGGFEIYIEYIEDDNFSFTIEDT